MYKFLFIDSNCTIEDDLSYANKPKSYFNKIAEKLKCSFEEVENFLKYFIDTFGNNVWEYHEIFWRAIAQKYGKSNDIKLINTLYDYFLEFYEESIELFDDTIVALTKLSKQCKLVLIANGNSKRLERLIKKFNLKNYFTDFVISSETPYRKPDAFMFNYALKKYNLNSYEVLMIGDRYDNDIKGAKNSNIMTALLTTKDTKKYMGENKPDFIVSSLSEIVEIVNTSKIINHFSIFSYQLLNSNKTIPYSAFIVAGGKGSRIGELGLKTQKCMLPIWDKQPILYYVLIVLRSVGCRKFVIAVDHLKEQIISHFGNGESLGIEIEYVSGEFKSTYDAIYSSLPKLEKTFFYVHGDILFNPQLLTELIAVNENNKNSCVALINNKNIHLTHAQMDIDKNYQITNIDLTERDEHFPYTFLGVGLYNKSDFLDYFDGNTLGMVEKFIKKKLDKSLTTSAVVYDGGWRHFETLADYEKARAEKSWEIFNESTKD